MPTATNRGVSLHYETDGDGPTVVFVGDVGYGAWLWGWHYDALAGPYETVVWDLRGTGDSDAPAGPYDVPTLAADLEAVLADHGVGSAHLVGAGLGGMIALRYAHEYNRARTLTLYCTAASGDAVDADALRSLSLDAGDTASLDGAFSPALREADPALVERVTEWRRADDATGEAFAAQAAAATGFEAPPLYEVTQPAEVYYGVEDPVVPVEAAASLADDLPRGTGEAVEGRHCCYVEHATVLTDRLTAFLDEHTDHEV
ncbi:alpha/beta hydrolase [Halomicroarcula sp. S1AR25-4]|uniref:alpha/beta fold hydrolase n=1 Tax=Haloarcula sp. S1AR25-4 TaxID=2950538 RepID=UPI0028756C15|nr:alpha/beta hydrolase [Halomicroarcula sp. S1AR25-4]MDS0279193.1 alpha/beta hydrolase [Halomicroarcula sp. S1AR25-4]